MIGTFVKGKAKIIDKVETINPNEETKKLLYKLALIYGKGSGIRMISNYMANKTDIPSEVEEKLIELFEVNAEKPKNEITRSIQNMLKIDDKFFAYDIENDIIHIFDISYNDIESKKWTMSEDLTKVIIKDEGCDTIWVND